MPARSNACSELTRFWLQARHGCLIDESVPVPVPYALSDIDLLALHPKNERISLPDGSLIGPRIAVETKDEHDWEPSGRDFGGMLRADVTQMGEGWFIPIGAKGVKFSMLRQQHYEIAERLFGTKEFDRLFVVHDLEPHTRADLAPGLAAKRIRLLTIREMVSDLWQWYRSYSRPAGLRNTLVGDLLHLLIGFCKAELPPEGASVSRQTAAHGQ